MGSLSVGSVIEILCFPLMASSMGSALMWMRFLAQTKETGIVPDKDLLVGSGQGLQPSDPTAQSCQPLHPLWAKITCGLFVGRLCHAAQDKVEHLLITIKGLQQLPQCLGLFRCGGCTWAGVPCWIENIVFLLTLWRKALRSLSQTPSSKPRRAGFESNLSKKCSSSPWSAMILSNFELPRKENMVRLAFQSSVFTVC